MTKNWPIIAASFLTIVFTFGIPTMVMPVIYAPIIDEFGWGRAQVTFVATLKFGAGAVFGIFFGVIVDKLSIRKIVAVASCLSAIAMLGFLWVQTLWQFYLVGLVLGMGSISCMIAIKVLVSQRFMHQQGLAIGSALLGTSVAGIFTPPFATWLIGIYGWRMTVALLSIGIWTVALPVFLRVVKDSQDAEIEGAGPANSSSQTKREESAAAAIDFSDVLKSRSFWMIGLAVSLIGFTDQSLGQHLMLYLIQEVNYSPMDAAWIKSAVFGVSIAGKLGFGWLYDKLSVQGVMLCYFLMAVSVLLMFPLFISSALVAFIITRGLSHGGSIVDIPVLSKHCFGPKVLGKTIGILTACVTIGFAIGPPLVGYMSDTQGSYRNAFIMLAVASIAAGLSLLGVKTTYRDRMIALERAAEEGRV